MRAWITILAAAACMAASAASLAAVIAPDREQHEVAQRQAMAESVLAQAQPGAVEPGQAPATQRVGPAVGGMPGGPSLEAFTCTNDQNGARCECSGTLDCGELGRSGECKGPFKCSGNDCTCPW